jgi:exodeoxyribonuclease V beta subunit
MLDLNSDELSQTLAEEERLAEDLRLLYVALTRSVYHCSVGIGPLIQGTRKKQGNTDLHLSALGYLVQKSQAADAQGLSQYLSALSNDDVVFSAIDSPEQTPWSPPEDISKLLSARVVERKIQDNWWVTSYSWLQQHGTALAQDLLPRLDVEAAGEQQPAQEQQMNAHTFPRGASPGTFLHSIFEEIAFDQPVDDEWLLMKLTTQGLEPAWLPVLKTWIDVILHTPLGEPSLTLSALESEKLQSELQFYLPIDGLLHAPQLDAVVKRYDSLSALCPPLDFQQVKGMLKGFIDLVFYWDGRYYLLDYKSNWLGEDSSAYTESAMQNAMAEHRYDLQYQLYTLALHRYLRHRVAGYDYQQHFGGIIYLFLRGVDIGHPGNGVFRCRPSEAFVRSLDRLFKGEMVADEPMLTDSPPAEGTL